MGFFDNIKDLAQQAKNAVQNNEKLKGFVDKAQKIAETTTQKAKETYENYKANQEAKRIEQEAHQREMKEKVEQIKQSLLTQIYAVPAKGGIWRGATIEKIVLFCNEFAKQMILPAMIKSSSAVLAGYLISDEKKFEFPEIYPGYTKKEKPLIIFPSGSKISCLLSDKAFYFSYPLKEDKKYIINYRIEADKISTIEIKENDECGFRIFCNGVEIINCDFTWQIVDLVTIQEFFRALKQSDLTITDKEIDELIHRKIGNGTYSKLHKYMEEDEYAVFFAWGGDSWLAEDYIVCTTKQLLIMNRELFGATSDIKQFYYEDISSIITEQNSNNDDLTGFLIETALVSIFKMCDLTITTAGTKHTIKTLNTAGAERVIEIFHQYRKALKKAAIPQVIIQKEEPKTDVLEQIKKMASLKEAGIISEEEFITKKTELLSKL